MTDILLYLKGYHHLRHEDDEDTEVWFKPFAHRDDSNGEAPILQSIRLLTSMWRTDENDVPIVEPAIFGKARFTHNGHSFMIDYDSSWSIEEIEKHALAVASCTHHCSMNENGSDASVEE